MNDDGFGQIREYVRTMVVYSLCGLSPGPVLKDSFLAATAPGPAPQFRAADIIVPKEKTHREYDTFVKLDLRGAPVTVSSGKVLSGAGVLYVGPFGEQT